jgi:Methyltransferase domain
VRLFDRIAQAFMLRLRPGRLKLFYKAFGIREDTRVLDMGGTPHLWALASANGLPLPQVTILNNRHPGPRPLPAGATWVVADAKNTPFDDFSFDVVLSNSLIEHLGDWESQRIFAREVRRLAPNYFIQTPNRRFPVEIHFMTPLIHWLPKSVQRRLVRNFTVWGILQRPSPAVVEQVIEEIRLLDRTEMKELFPDANILSEKFGGVAKSILACRTSKGVREEPSPRRANVKVSATG